MYEVSLDFGDNAIGPTKKFHTPLEVDEFIKNWRHMLGFEVNGEITIKIKQIEF